MNIRALPLYVTIGIFLLAYAVFWLQFPNILSTRVVGNLLTDNAYLGIVAVGMTLVILSGGIDLSVGSVIAFSGVFIAVMLRDTGLHPLAVFALLLALHSSSRWRECFWRGARPISCPSIPSRSSIPSIRRCKGPIG